MDNKANDRYTKKCRKRFVFILTLLMVFSLAPYSYAGDYGGTTEPAVTPSAQQPAPAPEPQQTAPPVQDPAGVGDTLSAEPAYGAGVFGVPIGSSEARDVWSLLSLLLALIAFLMAALIITFSVIRKEYDEEMWSADEDRERRRRAVRRIFRTLSVAFAFTVGMLWLFLDDLSLPMAWINRWTIAVAIVFIACIVCFAVLKTVKRERDDEDVEDLYGYTRDEAFDAIFERTGRDIDHYNWHINGENRKFFTMVILTLVLSACGAVNWILMSNFNIDASQFGGMIFLAMTGVPATITAAFDQDWILLGDGV
jgi:preprotein translocase subunit SecG